MPAWDPSNTITFHVVHRTGDDPLSNDIHASDWILEPDIKNEKEFETIQKLFSKNNMQDILPTYCRTKEFEKNQAKHNRKQIKSNGLNKLL